MGPPGHSGPPAKGPARKGSTEGQVTVRTRRSPQGKERRSGREAPPPGRRDASSGRSGNRPHRARPRKDQRPPLGKERQRKRTGPRKNQSLSQGSSSSKLEQSQRDRPTEGQSPAVKLLSAPHRKTIRTPPRRKIQMGEVPTPRERRRPHRPSPRAHQMQCHAPPAKKYTTA